MAYYNSTWKNDFVRVSVAQGNIPQIA